jgi:hypothetical protein
MHHFTTKTLYVKNDAQGLGEIDIRIAHPVQLLKIKLACAVQHPLSEDVLVVITSEMVGGETVGIVPLDQGAHVTPAPVDIQYSFIPPATISGNYKFHARKLDAENAPPPIPGTYLFLIEFHAPY